ncbi:hypothetical protein Taro_016756, partial [Colocasia esculenta]|nr:hypothetical protein [Colocasia esculenta]
YLCKNNETEGRDHQCPLGVVFEVLDNKRRLLSAALLSCLSPSHSPSREPQNPAAQGTGMAMQTGISSSKVLILMGAGLTGSVILRSGRLSDVMSELQELIKGINEVEISSHYDTSVLAAQGWSFSDVMFVTKRNMANAVATVSKQMEQVSATLASTRRHLSQRLEILGGKVEEQAETSKAILNEVNEVKSDLSQIGFDIEAIQNMVTGLDYMNAGIYYLCQATGGIKYGKNTEQIQDVSAKLLLSLNQSSSTSSNVSVKKKKKNRKNEKTDEGDV